MTFLTQDGLSANSAMQRRVAQCYAKERSAEDIDDPDHWSYSNRRTWAAAPGWDDAWTYALNTHEPGLAEGEGYDPGADESVITDNMILSQVQAMLTTD